jgi:hypothetical protein
MPGKRWPALAIGLVVVAAVVFFVLAQILLLTTGSGPTGPGAY